MSQNKPLTGKQELFARFYVANGFNGRKAALSAGYSEDSATTTASEILTYPNVIAFIEQLQSETAKKARKGADEIYEMASNAAFLDIGEVLEVDGATAFLKDGKKLSDLPKEIRILIQAIKPKKTMYGQVVEIVFVDKLKALEMLARFNGMNKDTLTIDSPYAGKSIEELQQIAKDKAAKLGLDAPK